jgi:hypothetical protein
MKKPQGDRQDAGPTVIFSFFVVALSAMGVGIRDL